MALPNENLPPPVRETRKSPDMKEGRKSKTIPYDKLAQLAGMSDNEGMGGNAEDQAAELVMSAAQQLMQAAQLYPPVQPMIGRVLSVLKSGVDELGGGGAGMEGEEEEGFGGRPKRRRRTRPPTGPSQAEDEGEMMGGL